MSWWSKLFGRKVSTPPYGLHPDNPVLCGGGVAAELDFSSGFAALLVRPFGFSGKAP